ncbi:MAG: hypothetical protein A2381_19310 [Bdellovibrionales bacterium RIFOXYB1_FULL_37_110]|nr:MAG: hypothetical protein A2181_00115 [Bdellovibrionales bacterium RIFOXYA1_FULL_38_20]OFZ49526.1 MAG: hypothetical protein A2417_04460 [Bdellovibrionales bacterium RIFOXYC1_FULL_37_79]OFZ58680.1 MAG: hypothetical protein A2381_19310 [Bdellovibrionales bacterium RIFOXYB1_FULL_37_110]OFZ63202.1 MAG: hypothetical protein A2577_16775 [Bdellovibrionales bacterium RIFOXYD1_FULL_36_51]
MRDVFLFIFAILLSAYCGYELFYAKKNSVRQIASEQVATITEINNEVRHKNHMNLSWEDSYKGASLSTKDMIFTGDNSSTIVVTKANVKIFVAPNTLLTLNESSGVLDLNLRQGVVDVIMQNQEGDKGLKAGGALINNMADKSVLRMEKLGKDSGESLKVIKGLIKFDDAKNAQGSVELDSRNTVIFGEVNQIKQKEAFITPMFPVGGEKLLIKRGEKIKFSWTSKKPFSSYSVMISKMGDKAMQRFEHISQTEFAKNLSTGGYLWQVIGLDGTSESSCEKQYFYVQENRLLSEIVLADFKPFSGTYIQIPFNGSKEVKFSWKKKNSQGKEVIDNSQYTFKLFKKDGKKGVLMDKRETSELEVSIPLTQIGTYVWAVVPENTDDLKDKPKLNYIKIDNARPPAPLIEKNIEFEILDKVIK